MKTITNSKLFNAYLLGGRIWPQLRWANNIMIINRILSLPQSSKSIHQNTHEFLNSQLSDQQIRILHSVMQQDHRNYNIKMRHPITTQMLRIEWIKTKIGVYNTLQYVIQNDNSNSLLQNDQYKSQIDWTKKLSENQIIIKESHLSQVKQAFSLAQVIIKRNKKLAYLFRKSYNNQQSQQQIINEIHKFYSSFSQNLHENSTRSQIRQILQKIIHTEIQKQAFEKFHKKIPWLIYDRRRGYKTN